MCGIAGILTRRPGCIVEASELEALRDAQRHRGPDDSGLWLSNDRHVGLAHRRLSIIDLSPGGHQPMSTLDGLLTIVFNGEIYNHIALREELERLGATFRSKSDTEVVLVGYRVWGPGVVNRLRGMFAFSIWDSTRRELFLARDHLGIKPLYYVDQSDRFAFASEIRALAKLAGSVRLDSCGLAEFLLWGSISAPNTLYREVRSLEPGHWLRLSDDGELEEGEYWRLEEAFRETETLGQEESFSRIADSLRDSVRHHLIADVPVGAFLSGGVDSVALVALLSEVNGGVIDTVTLTSDDPEIDESALAMLAARHYGTRHREIHLDVDALQRRIPGSVLSMDQPTIDGINTYLVSEAARQAGLKVAVSGVGGDELFGGYTTFQRVRQIIQLHGQIGTVPGGSWIASTVGKALRSDSMPRQAASISRVLEFGSSTAGAYFACRGLFSPAEIRSLLNPEILDEVGDIDPARWLSERIDLGRISPENHVSALEIRHYLQSQLLRDTDVASMAHSLEVRTPLVDYVLLSEVARVPAEHRLAGRAKRALRDAPIRPVPPEIWNRKKRGFAIPFDRWLRSGDFDLPLPEHPALNLQSVSEVERRFSQGRIHWSRLWALIVLGQFLK